MALNNTVSWTRGQVYITNESEIRVCTCSSSMSGGGGRWWSEWGGAARCLRAHLCLPTLAGRGAAAGSGAAREVAAMGGGGAAPGVGGAPCFFRPATRSVTL